jgi:hypothetical protein
LLVVLDRWIGLVWFFLDLVFLILRWIVGFGFLSGCWILKTKRLFAFATQRCDGYCCFEIKFVV